MVMGFVRCFKLARVGTLSRRLIVLYNGFNNDFNEKQTD